MSIRPAPPLVCLLALALPLSAQQPEQVSPCSVSQPVHVPLGGHSESCSISPTTDIDTYFFSGKQGEVVRIVVDGLTTAFDPKVELLSPTMGIIRTEQCDPGCCSTCTVLVEETLPETGVYFVFLGDAGANETGNYRLQIERIPPKLRPFGLDYSESLSDAISPTTDTDFVFFEGVAGTTVRVTLDGLTTAFDPHLEIFDPTGSSVPLVDVFCDPGCCSTCSVIETPVLPLGGTYAIAIWDNGWNETGNYNLTLTCFSPGLCPESPSGLRAAPGSISLSAGGTQTLTLDAGSANATRPYFVLGSSDGFLPGLPFKGTCVPLNWGGYLRHTLRHPNAPPLSFSLGLLDSNGMGTAQFDLPPGFDPSLAGVTLHHAFLVLDTNPFRVEFVGNATALRLDP